MRTVKILLLVALILVGALYGYTTVSDRMEGRDMPPVIRCDEEKLVISVSTTQEELLSKVTARDEQDGDLTASVQIAGISKLLTDNTAKITYVVFDSDHNVGTLTRYLQFTDYEPAKFTLSQGLIYYRNESIALLDRLSAIDVIDGDITSMVRVSSLNATSQAEVYTVDVQVTNSMGDTSRLKLPVIQLDGISIRPKVVLKEYLIYLPQGASFDSRSYLSHVEIPDGRGSNSDVSITGLVDTNTPGTYMVSYTYPYELTSGTSILTVVVE